MRSGRSAGKVALSAVLTALSLAILYAAVLAPTGRVGLAALAGLLPAAAVISGGVGAGGLCYAGTSILSVVLLPDKGISLLYILFFGVYPLVKYALERLRKRGLELLLKLAFFNLILTIFFAFLRVVFLSVLPVGKWGIWLIYLAGNVVFLLYDYGFTKLISFYTIRIDQPIRKNRGHG